MTVEPEFDPDDIEELEEAFTNMRYFMQASDVVARATPEELATMIGHSMELMGGCAEHLDNIAMILERVEPTKELTVGAAGQLQKVARYLRSGLPERETTTED